MRAHWNLSEKVTNAVGAEAPQFFARTVTVYVPGTANFGLTDVPTMSSVELKPIFEVGTVTSHSLSGAATLFDVFLSQTIVTVCGDPDPEKKLINELFLGAVITGAPMPGALTQATPVGGGATYGPNVNENVPLPSA